MADQATTNSSSVVTKPRKRKATTDSGPRKPKQKPVECPICFQARLPKLMLRLSTCNCEYCIYCVREAFSAGLEKSHGIPNFPARCCGRVLDYAELEEHLTPKLRKAYKVKGEEMSCDRPLHCANPTCGAFISEHNMKQGFGLCVKCKKKTCTKQECNRLQSEHSGIHTICPGFFEEEELNNLAEEKMWKRCPKCCAWTERIRGCNGMRCICRTQWCYKCGKSEKGKNPCVCYAKPAQDDDVTVQREVVIVHEDGDQIRHMHDEEDTDVKPSIEDLETDLPDMLFTESDLTAEMDHIEHLRTLATHQDSTILEESRIRAETDIMEELDALAAPVSKDSRKLNENGPENHHNPETRISTPPPRSATAENPTETLEELFRIFTANRTLSPIPVSSNTDTSKNSNRTTTNVSTHPEIHDLSSPVPESSTTIHPSHQTPIIEPALDQMQSHYTQAKPIAPENNVKAISKRSAITNPMDKNLSIALPSTSTDPSTSSRDHELPTDLTAQVSTSERPFENDEMFVSIEDELDMMES